LGGEIGAKSSFIAASMSTEASSSPHLLLSGRQFWAFADSQCLFQRIFVGNLGGLRAFSRCLPKWQAVRSSSSLKTKIRSTQET
jgi:hypothetical protein